MQQPPTDPAPDPAPDPPLVQEPGPPSPGYQHAPEPEQEIEEAEIGLIIEVVADSGMKAEEKRSGSRSSSRSQSRDRRYHGCRALII